jgi:uncharacterized membrane protein YeaQ/YmgE (transglycosylase-associated protein family)
MDIQALADFVSKNPWIIVTLAIVSLLGLVGTIWGLYLTFRSTKERQPRYSVATSSIVSVAASNLPDLEIHYRGYGERLSNVLKTDVYFFNIGREAIKKSDVAKASPIRVVAHNNAIILDAVIIDSNSLYNASIQRSADRRQATLQFDYVDHLAPIVISIVHTGTPTDIVLEGFVVNGGSPQLENDAPYSMVGVVFAGIFLGVVGNTLASVVSNGLGVGEKLPGVVSIFNVFLGAAILLLLLFSSAAIDQGIRKFAAESYRKMRNRKR